VDILAGHVPDRHEKFITITNGFDPEDFAELGVAVPREDDEVAALQQPKMRRRRGPRRPAGEETGEVFLADAVESRLVGDHRLTVAASSATLLP